MKDIKIKPVLNGFIVKIGCQRIVFTSLADMTKELKRYYGAKKPDEVEKDWLDNSINSNKEEATNILTTGGVVMSTGPYSGTLTFVND